MASPNINKQVFIYLKTSQESSPYDIAKKTKADKICLRSTLFKIEKNKQQMIEFELYKVCWQYHSQKSMMDKTKTRHPQILFLF